jgi:hypothetical protein
MGSLVPEEQCWLVQPLVDAGLGLDQIRTLVFRLAFDDIVSEGGTTLASVRDVVAGQPARIQSAWTEMIRRMLTLEGAGE